MNILITGGAGFIGSAVIRFIITQTTDKVVNVDKLTYAGNQDSLSQIESSERYKFERVDICNRSEIDRIFNEFKPDCVMHLAAESHVDRSIESPEAFVTTNVLGTYTLLEVAREYWNKLHPTRREDFRFHHISTDEVYGDLNVIDDPFTEQTPYDPSSPYSASKASSDHFVRAWHRTYGFPIIITNCSNNYGPYHFPEKLIPLTIFNALNGQPIRVYGNGTQIRDWLYVEDHAKALYLVITKGSVGETYNIGGLNEKTNIDVVRQICRLLEDHTTKKLININSYEDLITFVEDRPGHDLRYAIDSSKIQEELGWSPEETFNSGLIKTVEWYLSNQTWCQNVLARITNDGVRS